MISSPFRGRHPCARHIEGNRSRIQVAVSLQRCDRSPRSRRVLHVHDPQGFSVGVERTFPVHAPHDVDHIASSPRATCAAPLYYLCERHGKAAKIKGTPLRQGRVRLAATCLGIFHGKARHRALVLGPRRILGWSTRNKGRMAISTASSWTRTGFTRRRARWLRHPLRLREIIVTSSSLHSSSLTAACLHHPVF